MADVSDVRITKRAVDALSPPASGEVRLWDTDVKGFCLRAYATGRKTYAVKYRTRQGRQRWQTIGRHGSPWTPETARAEAKAILMEVARGEDPAEQRARDKADLTVSELIDRYLTEGPTDKPDKRASSWGADRSNLDRHVRKLLGRRIARSVTQSDAARMVSDIISGQTADDFDTGPRGRVIVRGGSGTAARTLGTTAAMYAWAIRRGLVDANPFKGVRLPKRAAVERFLSGIEAAGLLQAIDRVEVERRIHNGPADIFRLLLLTGARRSEIALLRWSEVDLIRGRLVLAPQRSKSGGRSGERRIVLSPDAVSILRRRERRSDWVFPSTDPTKPSYALQKPWRLVREAAGQPALRLHDLRHSFASLALEKGASLPLIGKALGHSTSRVTERYAHLTDDPLERLAAEVSKTIRAGG